MRLNKLKINFISFLILGSSAFAHSAHSDQSFVAAAPSLMKAYSEGREKCQKWLAPGVKASKEANPDAAGVELAGAYFASSQEIKSQRAEAKAIKDQLASIPQISAEDYQGLTEAKAELEAQQGKLKARINELQRTTEEEKELQEALENLISTLQSLDPKKLDSFINSARKNLEPFGISVSLNTKRGKGSHSLLTLGEKAITCPRTTKPYILKQIQEALRSWSPDTKIQNSEDQVAELEKELNSLVRRVSFEKEKVQQQVEGFAMKLEQLQARMNFLQNEISQKEKEVPLARASLEALYRELYLLSIEIQKSVKVSNLQKILWDTTQILLGRPGNENNEKLHKQRRTARQAYRKAEESLRKLRKNHKELFERISITETTQNGKKITTKQFIAYSPTLSLNLTDVRASSRDRKKIITQVSLTGEACAYYKDLVYKYRNIPSSEITQWSPGHHLYQFWKVVSDLGLVSLHRDFKPKNQEGYRRAFSYANKQIDLQALQRGHPNAQEIVAKTSLEDYVGIANKYFSLPKK